jgi:uncharacterized protein (DUF3084 family)
MSTVAIATLLAVGLIVVALAVALIIILALLRRTIFTLGTINVGLRSIARRVGPLEPVLGEVNSDLTRARDALNTALAAHQQRNGSPSHRTVEELTK